MPEKDPVSLLNDRTCWRKARAERLAVIVDAADFFRAAKEAMLKARRSVLLIGWDFDARIKLEPEGETLEGPNAVGSFLNWLAKRRSDLEIRILKWDAGVMQSLARGETPFYMLQWLAPGRVEMRLDHAHPPLAAHHMKLIVIDDAVAFCGGIDMTLGRWDTCAHEEGRKGRRSPWGFRLDPWHDATTCISGPAAEALGALARQRWLRATGEDLQPVKATHEAWPESLKANLRDIQIGIARTIPAYDGHAQVSEIEALKLAIIAGAKQSLYIESQYFASITIAKAIAARLAEPDPPEIVVLNPDTAEGWLEAKVMDSARTQMLQRIRAADRQGRFRILYPVNEAGTPIYVHAKIMIADDQVLKIGSANLNNRSMGFDTECDVVLEAGGDRAVGEEILAIRNRLLAEHLGQEPQTVEAALARAGGSMIAAIDALNGEAPRLEPMPMRELTAKEEALADSDLADPERPRDFWRSLPAFLRR
ncbi:phospholipase D-like domain-containing protein [Afifella pfennigii]|uniref:phospholipase D-like domain-containing protein n=1 Tax=Afifella pfennigii TaxID=209897 RepID=UPI00047973A4|nr:phospholipase D-like domain-containing protein [Afifella pfennigii]